MAVLGRTVDPATLDGMRHSVLPSVILAIVALALTVAVAVGWNVIFVSHYPHAFDQGEGLGLQVGYWMLMAMGDLFLATVITAIAIFLGVMIRRSHRLRMQDAFIDRITHELRTPIAALRLSVDTCTRHDLDATTMRQQLSDMRGDLDRLQDLVDHVIDAGRLEHGEWRPGRDRIDLVELAHSCSDTVRRRYALDDDQLVCHVDPGLPHATGDRVAVEHILLNLLDNGVKYSDRRPEVRIDVHADGDEAVIAVRDRGIGVHPKERTRIFRRFHRTPTTDRTRPGTGLGLYVVQQLCRQLGGSVETSDNGDQPGSTFTVRLPLVHADG